MHDVVKSGFSNVSPPCLQVVPTPMRTVMEHIEDLALSMSPVPTIFWKRYVVDEMLAHINSIDHNIQFTLEREEGHAISFLDVKRFLLSQCSPSRKDEEEKDDPRFCVTIPYIQPGVSEVVTRIPLNIDAQVHMKPFRTLRRILSYPKDHIPDGDKSNIVYKINCRDCDAW